MARSRKQVSAQEKMISINNKFGNTGIKHQQGTSRILYDTLKLLPSNKAFTLTFFENVKTRKFPYTNLPENKLQVGETFTIEDYYFNLVLVDRATDVVIFEKPFEAFVETQGLYRADLDFMIGETRVLKQLKVGSSRANFNYGATFDSSSTIAANTPGGGNYSYVIEKSGHDVYPLRTDLIVPPDIEFIAPVKFSGILALPTVAEGQDWYVCLTMEGAASILAPRTTF